LVSAFSIHPEDDLYLIGSFIYSYGICQKASEKTDKISCN